MSALILCPNVYFNKNYLTKIKFILYAKKKLKFWKIFENDGKGRIWENVKFDKCISNYKTLKFMKIPHIARVEKKRSDICFGGRPRLTSCISQCVFFAFLLKTETVLYYYILIFASNSSDYPLND